MHKLIILDADNREATCSCGLWLDIHTQPTDGQTVRDEFLEHVQGAKWTN